MNEWSFNSSPYWPRKNQAAPASSAMTAIVFAKPGPRGAREQQRLRAKIEFFERLPRTTETHASARRSASRARCPKNHRAEQRQNKQISHQQFQERQIEQVKRQISAENRIAPIGGRRRDAAGAT